MVVDDWTAKPFNNYRRIKQDRHHLAKYIVADCFVDTRILRRDLLLADDWAAKGFPASPVTAVPVTPRMTRNGKKCHPVAPVGRQDDFKRSQLKIAFATPDCGIELSKVCDGEWVQHCQRWAVEGLPAEDSIFLVVSQLARWLFFIELWEMPVEQRLSEIAKILTVYCLTKNNGRISRLADGLEKEVAGHVERIIDCAIRKSDQKGKLVFAELRQRRASGVYKHVLHLSPLLAGETSSSFLSSSVGFTLCCSDLKPATSAQQRRNTAKKWKFISDDQALPSKIEAAIRNYYRNHSLRLYKPTFRKLTRFINYLWQQNGEARLGVKALKQMGFSDHAARKHISYVDKCGIISTGGYCPAEGISKKFKLTKQAKELLAERLEKRKLA